MARAVLVPVLNDGVHALPFQNPPSSVTDSLGLRGQEGKPIHGVTERATPPAVMLALTSPVLRHQHEPL